MKRIQRSVATWALALTAWMAACAPGADVPSWWTNVLDSAEPADHAPVLLGQLKWFATNACNELEIRLLGGAGTNVAATVAGFSSVSNYHPASIGQLKATAKPFWDRLNDIGFTNGYPWTASVGDDADQAVATIGQLKTVFQFDFGADSDGDGLDDWVESGSGIFTDPFDTGTSPTNTDSDADGVLDGIEIQNRTDPTSEDNTAPTLVIITPTNGFKWVWMP